MSEQIEESIKWRGSTYVMDKVEDGKVFWHNPISRHEDSCSIESWKHGDPYEGRYT